jgi:8-oxo-dGTP diphosphatase
MTDAAFAVVRTWFTAWNRGDLPGLLQLYVDDAEVDLENEGVLRGRAAIARVLGERLAAREPALDEGARRRMRTVAQVESGISAEWVASERLRDTGIVEHAVGQDLFVIEHGRIVRQREVARRVESPPDAHADDARPSTRRYPERPIVGVGAVVLEDGQVLLIKRRFEPLAGQWSLPGGTLEIGETLAAGVARELLEETGLVVEVGPVVDVFDRILFDPDQRVRYHFVLIDYLCRPVGGQLQAGSDVADACFADPADLAAFRMTPKTMAVIERALAMAAPETGGPAA